MDYCRPGPWGNRGLSARQTLSDAMVHSIEVKDAAHAVAAVSTLHDATAKELSGLGGKTLMCWCAPDAPCHADFLLEIANAGPVNDKRMNGP